MQQRVRNNGAAQAFVVIGTAAIVAGGLISALTARTTVYHSAWVVAYLVLIVGVSQVALGLGQWRLASSPLGARSAIGLLVLFNLGNAGVILGSLTATTIWVDLGSALLIAALIFFGWTVRSGSRTFVWWLYWAFVVMLAVSVVVGLVFAHTGAR